MERREFFSALCGLVTAGALSGVTRNANVVIPDIPDAEFASGGMITDLMRQDLVTMYAEEFDRAFMDAYCGDGKAISVRPRNQNNP